MFGYRANEVGLEGAYSLKNFIRLKPTYTEQFDKPMSRSLPIYVHGVALPRVDARDTYSSIYGLAKRVVQRPMPTRRQSIRRFRGFVSQWIRKNLKPLRSDSDVSVASWLDSTSYPKSRKDVLMALAPNANADYLLNHLKDLDVESHIKDESYIEYKNARWINSRSDTFKVATGPIFKLIEKELFGGENTAKYFIKYVPVADRPKWIKEHIYHEGWVYHSTDYTSFESLFTPRLMKACEMQLYEYMTRDLPAGSDWYKLVKFALCDHAYTLSHGDVSVKLKGTRMSGEMCTSLGNGFMNLMVALYTLRELNLPSDHVVVEGDDGLFAAPVPINADIPAGLGLRIKMETTTELGEASFCGNVFDPNDDIVLVDPLETLVDFGWTKKVDIDAGPRRLDLLLRAKAYSLLYQYRANPVLESFARYVLRVTKRAQSGIEKFVTKGKMNEYERGQLKEAIEHGVTEAPSKISFRSRTLVEKLYNVTVKEQLALESYFDGLTKIQVLDSPELRRIGLVKPIWQEYFESYSVSYMDRVRADPRDAIAGCVGNSMELQNMLADKHNPDQSFN